MEAPPDCHMKTRTMSGKKVSKPLMEKKRRARINKSLDQLKSLLETYYTNNVRKRKLEKADILEMTVKHLRNLQRRQRGSTVDANLAEYQAGFRSCLAGVNRYLQVTNGGSRTLRLNVLDRLSRSLSAPVQDSSTADSSRVPPEAIERKDPRSTEDKQGSSMALNTVRHIMRDNEKGTCVNMSSLYKKKEVIQEHVKLYNGHQAPEKIRIKYWNSNNRCLTERPSSIKHAMVCSQDFWRPW
uniref:Hairy-related 3 n=1 Tax=Paramormyrops kingsleyae TaxID=1676925 RepID=A0A3B3SUL2_9TELE|nr:transcription factor HES-3 [Paramormyrops kingsleyae]